MTYLPVDGPVDPRKWKGLVSWTWPTDRTVALEKELLKQEYLLEAAIRGGVAQLPQVEKKVETWRRFVAVSKVEMTQEFIAETIQADDKILVLARTADAVEGVRAALKVSHGAVSLYENGTEHRRAKAVARFRMKERCRVMVATPRAIALRDDPVFYHRLVVMDPDWDPRVMLAVSAHIGLDNVVWVIRNGSPDEQLTRLIRGATLA